LVTVFLIGFLLLFSPVVPLFERPPSWFGIPTLYLYLFGVWAAIIAATAFIVSGDDE
jgi:hypothetical protein